MDDIDDDQQFPSGEEFVPYASGATLAQHVGRKVRCWGRASAPPSASGTEIVLRTVDDVDVTVRLRAPLSSRPSPTAWFECVGTAQSGGGRCAILADELTPFAEEACADVDRDGHRGLAQLLVALDDPWSAGGEANGASMDH